MTHNCPDIFWNIWNIWNIGNKPSGLPVSHVRRRGKINAFTLIEIIVVIAIIAMLVMLTVGMSRYLSTRSGVQKTRAIQTVFMHALDAFIEEGGQEKYAAFTNKAADPNNYDQIRTPFDSVDPNYPNYSGSKFVMNCLRETPEAVDKLRALPEGAIYKNDEDLLVDGFENRMLYDHDGGLGGKPVLISAGPDRKFLTDDDINSDKH